MSADPVLTFTVGDGVTNVEAIGREITCPASDLAQQLNNLPMTNEGWWSLGRFEGCHLLNKKWLGSSGVIVDLDTVAPDGNPKNKPLLPFTLADLRASRAAADCPANLIHLTPRGLRLVFVLAQPVEDEAGWVRVAAGAMALSEAWLAALGPLALDKDGRPALEVDDCSSKRAQRYFRPKSWAKGAARHDEALPVKDREPYHPEVLKLAGGPGVGAVRRACAWLSSLRDGRRKGLLSMAAMLARMPEVRALGEDTVAEALLGACQPGNSSPDDRAKAVRDAWAWGVGQQAVRLRRNPDTPESAGQKGHKGGESGLLSLLSRHPAGIRVEATAPEWPPLEPVRGRVEVPPFPVDALPPAMRRWVDAVAGSLACPADLPAVLALGAASACVAARYAVQAKADWREPINLYLLLGLPSGESKSAAYGPATRAMREWDRQQYQEGLRALTESKSKRRELERRLKQAEQEAAEGGSDEARAAAAQALAAHRLAEPPRLLADNITPESLGALMSKHAGRIAAFSDEGALLEILAGRYSDGKPQVELFNQAWTGSTYLCDRVGRDPVRIEAPSLTTVLAVQPSCVEQLADSGAFKTKGVLARFLFALPRSSVGQRRFDGAPVPESVQESYDDLIRALLALPDDRTPEGDGFKPRGLVLSFEARAAMLDLRARLEPRLAPGKGDLEGMAEWVNKAHGQAVRVAGILHLLDVVGQGRDPRHLAVMPDTMRRALAIVEGYFLPHAMAAHDLMATSPGLRRLRLLARWIENLPEGQRYSVTQRDAHRRLDDRNGVDADEVRHLLGELVARGYLCPAPKGDGTGGRPKGPEMLVNPALFEQPVRVPGMEG